MNIKGRRCWTKSSACLVNANVGSSKTTVLTVKIRYLHESADISYRDMVVFTLTNKAANEIKERLAASEEASNLPDMRYFGTFHSVALQLLREVLPVGQLGYTADFQVMDPEEELDLALELIRERKLQIKYKNRLKKDWNRRRQVPRDGTVPVFRTICRSFRKR